jgi:hypothetical protein
MRTTFTMKISLTEYEVFREQWKRKSRKGGEWQHLRYGQAWFNYFKLHQHNINLPEGSDERVMLDRLYNTVHTKDAEAVIAANFLDRMH